MFDRPANRLGLAFTRALIAIISRSVPTRHYRCLGLAGILDTLQTSGWRIRILSARYDLIWGNDVNFQERHRITAHEAIIAWKNGAILVDVRSPGGRARNGEIAEAVVAPKSLVVDLLSRHLKHGAGPFILFCGSVAGTTPLVEALVLEGLTQVYEVDGGFASLAEVGTLQVSERLLT